MGHFAKRELESMFVHVFSRPTLPFAGSIKNYIHYWLVFGAGVGYELFNLWKPPTHSKRSLRFWTGLFLVTHPTLTASSPSS